MKRAGNHLLLCAGILAALAHPVFAETRTISWNPVTTYTDGTSIESGKTVNYTAYWTTDPGLGFLHVIVASTATTSATFDPDVQGMTRGGTVYFTAKAVLSTGEESVLSPAYSWVVPAVTPTSTAILTSVSVSGPPSLNEGGTATYSARGTWDNGSTVAIIPTWSENSSYATISSGGVLTASSVTSNQSVTVTASYGGRTGTASISIVDVPATVPAAARNIGITGPIISGSNLVWRLAWAPVTTYTNGAPIEGGRTVRYTVYWSDDPALSPASLRQVAPLVTTTAVDFNPVTLGMPVNVPAWLTVKTVLDDGTPSSLGAAVEWVVANAGPTAPAAGSIQKR